MKILPTRRYARESECKKRNKIYSRFILLEAKYELTCMRINKRKTNSAFCWFYLSTQWAQFHNVTFSFPIYFCFQSILDFELWGSKCIRQQPYEICESFWLGTAWEYQLILLTTWFTGHMCHHKQHEKRNKIKSYLSRIKED